MSILGRIFATERAVEQSIDAVVRGLDKLVYTNEEKAEATAASRAKAQEMLVDWLNASTGHNIARRWLTVNIASVWLLQLVLGMCFAVAAVWAPDDKADRVLATAGLLQGYAAEMGTIVLIIILFYFAAPHMSSFIDVLLARIGIRATSGTGGK